MHAQVVSSEPKEINLSIQNTDVGLLYIIQHELLKTSGIDFAGVIIKHPLTNECWMRVNSNAKPIQEIKKATETAIKTAEALKKLFNSTIKGN
ncbi:MAG TPA: RpoL/Rpb11 RNA polymerase subunit family protein [Nitrosopumilaceae archaeon]|jgi:DNA-directed RNA polymerase subunit L|nr:RpoL/Rpb11 RNA polymerase subunit family protein [Nitrosopumilaceae archaeon]